MLAYTTYELTLTGLQTNLRRVVVKLYYKCKIHGLLHHLWKLINMPELEMKKYNIKPLTSTHFAH